MILKWGIGGAVFGLIISVLGGIPLFQCLVVGFFMGIALRKWILRNLWM